jgi:hypothetical protein
MVVLPVGIEYFDRSEISVLFDGVVNARQWAWVGDTDHTISFTPAVANGVEVSIKRTTDISVPRHQFSQGAQFTTESLDEDLRQVLHIAQEAKEGSGLGEVYQDLNFHGFKAINMGNGSDPGDAVNHAQMEVHDATIVGYMTTTEGYKNAAAASAAAALASETGAAANVAVAIGTHVAELDPHTQYLKEVDIDLANLAKVNVAQNFTLPQRSALLTDNDGAFDLAAKQNFKCTTAGAVTLTFTSQADGLSGSIIFVNSSNNTVSAHANTKLTAADLAKLSVTGTYRIDYLSDGTNAYCSVVGAYA